MMTPIEELIRILEAFKRGGIHDTGARTPLDGFNIALRIIRTISTTSSISDQGDRLINAFEEYAHTQKHMRTLNVQTCSECGQTHNSITMIRWKGDGSERYWYLCSTALQPAYHFTGDID